MSWLVYNGFKFIIDCIIVYNNLNNNDWNDFEYILILFVNIFYYIVIFNIVIDYINVLLYILILFISNFYYICNWIYYDYIFVFIYILILFVSNYCYICICVYFDFFICFSRLLYCCFRVFICWLSFFGNFICCFSAICRSVFIICFIFGFNLFIVR